MLKFRTFLLLQFVFLFSLRVFASEPQIHPGSTFWIDEHQAITEKAATNSGLGLRTRFWLWFAAILPDLIEAQDKNNYRPEHHFDRNRRTTDKEAFLAGAKYLREQKRENIVEAKGGNKNLALAALGRALHALQDFYAHSNYVDLPDTDKQKCFEALYDGTGEKMPPNNLKLTGYDPKDKDPEAPKDDNYPHRDFAKDNPIKNREAMETIGGETKFVLAKQSAIDESQNLFKMVKDSLAEQEWDSLITGQVVLDTDYSGSIWACTDTTDTCGTARCLSCSDMTLTFDAGTLLDSETVSVWGVQIKSFSEVHLMGSSDSVRIYVLLDVRTESTTEFSPPAFCQVHFTPSDLSPQDTSLAVYYYDTAAYTWKRVPNSRVYPQSGIAEFPVSSPGNYAVGSIQLTASLTPSNLTGFGFLAGSPNDTFVYFYNRGSQGLTVNSIVADNPNASVTVAPYGAPPFVIPEGGAPAKVFLNFDGTSQPCSSYIVTWRFNTNAPNSNVDTAGLFKVKAQFALATASQPFFQARSLAGLNQPIETNGWRVNFSNAGTVGGSIGSRTGMYVIQADTGAHMLSQGTAYMGAILSNGDTGIFRNIYSEGEFRPLYIEGALNETIQVKDTVFTDSVSFAQALQQGRPAKAGSWKIARVAYAIDLFNDLIDFPDLTPEAYPWPGVWMGYWFKDQFWFKNTGNYHWLVWYRQKIKKAPPCWWPDWPGSPTIATEMYDGVACDWDPFSDSLDLSTGVNLPINSSGYNDTMKFAWARGRGNPFNRRYAAQVFLVDTTVHLRGDTVCVGTNCNVDPCSLSAVDPKKRIFGSHALSYEGYAAQTGSYLTRQLWPWVTRPGVSNDFINNKQDVTILTTHACFSPSVDTFNYALGLSVSIVGWDTLKKAINEMRFAMALDTIKGTACLAKPGDVDGNGSWTLTDIVALVGIVFKGAPKPTPWCRTDCNGTGGNPSLTDIVCLVMKVFKSGPNPVKIGECCKD